MTDRRKYLHQSRFAAIRAMLWSKAWNLWGRTWIQTGGKYVVITIAKYHKVKIIITNRKYSWNHQFVHCQNQPCYHCYFSWLLNIYEVAICCCIEKKNLKSRDESDDKLSTFGLPYLPDVLMLSICGEDILHANRIHPNEPTNNYHDKKLQNLYRRLQTKQQWMLMGFFQKIVGHHLGGWSTSWTPFHFLGIYFMHANKIQRRKIEFLPCMIAGEWDVLRLQQRKKYISS